MDTCWFYIKQSINNSYLIISMLNSSRGRQEVVPVSVENFIQDFILNLSEGVAQAAQLPVYVQYLL